MINTITVDIDQFTTIENASFVTYKDSRSNSRFQHYHLEFEIEHLPIEIHNMKLVGLNIYGLLSSKVKSSIINIRSLKYLIVGNGMIDYDIVNTIYSLPPHVQYHVYSLSYSKRNNKTDNMLEIIRGF